MRLISLNVVRLPGVHQPYQVEPFSPGVTVVIGPNASGKSSLMRALTALWNPKLHEGELVEVAGEFLESLPGGAEVSWRATRVGKKVVWERDGEAVRAPQSPPAHLLGSYLVSIETLMQSGDTDAAIGDALRREMSGGFDLNAARKGTELPTQGSRLGATALRNAQLEVRELERKQAALFGQVGQREKVEERWVAAAALAAEAPLYVRGLELAHDLAQLSELQATLSAMPSVLGRLSGDEASKLSGLEEKRAHAEAALARAEIDLRRGEAALAETGLADAQVDWATAEKLERAARSLDEAAAKAVELGGQVAQLNGELREPWRRLGGEPKGATGAAFDAANLEAAEALLSERLSAAALMQAERSDISRLEAEIDALNRDRSDHASLSEAQLRQAQAQLGSWLAAEPSPQRPRVQAAPALVLLLAAVLLGIAALVGVGEGSFGALLQRISLAGPAVASLASVGAAALLVGAAWLLIGTLIARKQPTADMEAAGQAQVAQKAYLRTGASQPFEWSHRQVSLRLQELISEESRRRVVAARLSVANDALRTARQRLGEASGHLGMAERKLRQLAQVTGYKVPAGEAMAAGFTAWLRDARQADDLLGRLQGLHAVRQKLEERGHALYLELVEGLAGTPFAVTAVVEGVAGWREGRWRSSKLGEAEDLRVRAEGLKKAVGARDRAQVEVAAAQRELANARSALAAAEQARAELLERCELEGSLPDAAARVHALVALLPAHRHAAAQAAQLGAVVRNAEQALVGAPHVLAAAMAADMAALEHGKREAERAAEERDALGIEIGDLNRQVRDAEDGRALERARSGLELARQAVANRVRRAQLNAATEFLFGDVESEHRSRQEPAVLRRARTWFERFTHGAFTLEFDPTQAQGERLSARDLTYGRRLGPAELSTGTRAQLLLALRVAYATCAEEGYTRFPFFLDEALTTADPRRFEEVATSLLELARDDERQIIYLSARSEDAHAWKRVAERLSGGEAPPVEVIDLAQVRQPAP